MVARHSIERAPRAIREFISSLSRSLAFTYRMRALVVSRATTTGVAPRGEHTRLYEFMYQKWWVHLFVISSCFCFYRDFIYDRIAEPQICDEIGWRVLFAGARMYICTYVRPSVRPSVHPFAGPVRSFVRLFVRSVASFRGAFIFTIICGGGGDVVIRRTFTMCRLTRTASNDNEPNGWFTLVIFLFFIAIGTLFLLTSLKGKQKSCDVALKFALPFIINFQFGRITRGDYRSNSECLLATFNAGSWNRDYSPISIISD